jgi:hypothetical protein
MQKWGYLPIYFILYFIYIIFYNMFLIIMGFTLNELLQAVDIVYLTFPYQGSKETHRLTVGQTFFYQYVTLYWYALFTVCHLKRYFAMKIHCL